MSDQQVKVIRENERLRMEISDLKGELTAQKAKKRDIEKKERKKLKKEVEKEYERRECMEELFGCCFSLCCSVCGNQSD